MSESNVTKQKLVLPDNINQALRTSCVLNMIEFGAILDLFAMYLSMNKNTLNAESIDDEQKIYSMVVNYTQIVESLEKRLERAFKSTSGF